MRACFLGQNVTGLGFGVALLQTPPLAKAERPENSGRDAAAKPVRALPDAEGKLPLPA